MKSGPVMVLAATLAALGVTATSCGSSSSDCLNLPCAMPVAISLNVSASTGGAVAGVVVRFAGAANGTGSCNADTNATTCYVMGTAGTYDLEVVASGFQTLRRTVSVLGDTPACGCPSAVTQHLDIVLNSAP